MEKVYKANFWEDRIWITIIPGFLGLVSLLTASGGVIAGFYSVLEGEVSFGAFVGVFFIFLLPFLAVGGICFYIFLYGIKTKIIINDKFLILDAPFYKRKIPITDIKKIVLRDKSADYYSFWNGASSYIFQIYHH